MPSGRFERSSPPALPPDRWAPAAGLAVWNLASPGALARFGRLFVEVERRVHAFVDEPERWERLEAEAAALRARWPPAEADDDPAARPPLYGVPIGVKDVFHVRGLPTRAGSRLPLAALESGDLEREAESVRRLRAAGALVLGKTVATELAYFEPGPTENPRAPGHTPGGSSSGSAAAVAAGLCPLALGTQTIGSICRPAAFCGIVGFKPSAERIPRCGLLPLAPSLDHVGVLAADVAWAQRGAVALCDDWREDLAATSDRAATPSLAVPTGAYLDALEREGVDGFAAARARLGDAGWSVREVPAFPAFAELVAAHRTILAAEMAAAHGERLERHPGVLRSRTVELIERGRAIAPAALAAARERRREVRDALAALMAREGVDLWLSPAAPGPPPLGLAATGDPIMNLPWTFAGLPTVALPAGETADDLPLAVQLTAAAGADEALLAWAETLAAPLAGRGDDGDRR